MTDRPEALTEILRRRVLRGRHAGSLRPGDRLPSTRELAGELGVDHRAVVAAYRELEADGVVELRPRSGAYVPAAPHGNPSPAPPVHWLAELHLQGMARGIPVPELSDWIYRASATLRLRAVIIASTVDQAAGLCRELRDDFGLEASALPASDVAEDRTNPTLRRADLLVTTAAHASWVLPLGDELGKRTFVVTVRPDLLDGEWRLLLKRPLYVVAADTGFESVLRQFLGDDPGAQNLRVVMADPDAVRAIPPGAPTYVTRGAATRLEGVQIPGRVLPAARVVSEDSAREIITFIVSANLEALLAVGTRRSGEP